MSAAVAERPINVQNWGDLNSLLLCHVCRGENPHPRMLKNKQGNECKTCNRPFDVYIWNPGPRRRLRKPEVCETCSMEKNICQCCLIDLDHAEAMKIREARQRIAAQATGGSGNTDGGGASSKARTNREAIRLLPCSTERYGGNIPQEIRRFMPRLESPEDKTVTTLFVGNLNGVVEKSDLEDILNQHSLKTSSIELKPKDQCAFAKFTSREIAERAAELLFNRLIIKGQKLNIKWARPQGHQKSPNKGGKGKISFTESESELTSDQQLSSEQEESNESEPSEEDTD